MARLHEFQGKQLLHRAGIATPTGRVATSADEAFVAACELDNHIMVKVQAWTTGRVSTGGVAKVDSASAARDHAKRMLAMTFGRFPVTHVLVEECVDIEREFFVSFAIDERARSPVLLFSANGGTGIEDRGMSAHRISCDVSKGPDEAELRAAIVKAQVSAQTAVQLETTIRSVFDVARTLEARSLEINPLVLTKDNRIVAADCRITIDDYAVARHPELGIDIARELDHPPTLLERVAYRIEQEDHRGTFFFAQMNTRAPQGSKGLIGFHGAGGGGSMMSMDAITNEGFTPANFCDTSGNPSPAKVYRAARIILCQPNLVGYFGSGSGVANQEQFWSAYGLAKAFWEMELSVPAVIRLGGNSEDRAVDILESASRGLPAQVEGYKKSDSPAKIAARFAALVADHSRNSPEQSVWIPRAPRRPAFVGARNAIVFPLLAGRLHIDLQSWNQHAGAIIARANGLLRDDAGIPAPTLPANELATRDSDLIACEVECRRDNVEGLFVELDVPSMDDAAAPSASPLTGKAGA